MRVGFYLGKIQSSDTGGGATFQINILNKLIETNSEHELFVLYDSPERLYEDKKNIKFINMDINPKKSKFLPFKKQQKRFFLNEKVQENNIEFVWSLIPSCPFVEAPFAVTVWDLQHRLQPYFPEVSLSGWTFENREKFYNGVLPRASYVITGNNQGAKEIEQFYRIPNERIKRIAFPTPDFVYQNSPDTKILKNNELEAGEYLFYPAQFWPHKNHIRILKALSILKEKGFKLKVAFSGSDKGNENYIKQKAKEYNLENEVKFLGFVSQEELIALYKNALAMTFASMFGPDNIPPLESMALGCPVVCSNSPGMEEQLRDSALFFNPKDEHLLAEHIKNIYENKDLKESLKQKGYELSKNLTTQKYIDEIFKVINEFAPTRECWSNQEKYIHL